MSSSPVAVVLDDLARQLPGPDAPSVVLTDSDRQTLAEALVAVPDPPAAVGACGTPFTLVLSGRAVPPFTLVLSGRAVPVHAGA